MTENSLGSIKGKGEVLAEVSEKFGEQVETTESSATAIMSLISGEMVLVDLSIGQWGAKSRWSPAEFGLQDFETIDDPEIREAVSGVYGYGERMFLPPAIKRELTALTMQGRNNFYSHAYKTPLGYAMTVAAYQEFKEKDQEIRGRFEALVEDVIQNLDEHVAEIVPAYAAQATMVYRRMFGASVNDESIQPSHDFVRRFVDEITSRVPDADRIRGRFYWRTRVWMPVSPSMVEAEKQRIDDLRRAGAHQRALDDLDLNSELATRAQILDEIRASALEETRAMIQDIVRQVNTHAFSVARKVKDSIARNDGKLVGKSVQALSNLLEWAALNAPTTNDELAEVLADLRAKFGDNPETRDLGSVQAVLSDLERVTRQTLLDLARNDDRQVREIKSETKDLLSFDSADLRAVRPSEGDFVIESFGRLERRVRRVD